MRTRDAWTLAAGWSCGVACTVAVTDGPNAVWMLACRHRVAVVILLAA